MVKARISFILAILVGLTLSACRDVTQEKSVIHLQITADLDDVTNLQDAIIDRLADLALGKGDKELASGLAIMGHELRKYLTDTDASIDSKVTITLNSDSQGGTFQIHYMNEKQQLRGNKHRLSYDQTQRIHDFLIDWSSKK